jgi:hypothetical protein
MENLQNELISFVFITIVVLMLAYLTKKKEDQYKKLDDED